MEGRSPSRARGAALIYLMPALMDMVIGLALFVGTVRAARGGGDAVRTASVLAVWSLVYVTTCLVVGRGVSTRNARGLVLAGCALVSVSLGLLALADGFVIMLVLMGFAGFAAAFFFPSFQIFMKATDTAGGRSLAWSTGLYTFAWSTGLACGPFISGFLMQVGAPSEAGGEGPGWRVAFLFGAAVCLFLTLGLAAGSGSRPAAPRGAGDAEPARTNGTYDSMPDRVWIGWLGTGAGFASLGILRAVFPSRALGPLGVSASMLGSILFILCMTQALVGLAMMRSRFWMYRALPLSAFAASGVIGLLCFGFGTTPAVLVIGAVLFGVFSGSFCFSMVFHALVHPSKAGRYVAVNESLVGMTGFLAPLLAGALTDAWGFPVSSIATAALVGFVAVIQVLITRTGGKPAEIRTPLAPGP
jgi:MFS family permease